MGLAHLEFLMQEFQRHGADPALPVAIVENGTRANQITGHGNASPTIARQGRAAGLRGPTIIIVGDGRRACATRSTGISRKARSNMPSNEQVLAALSRVAGPDGKTPLTETGALSGLNIHDGKVYVTLNVASEQARTREPMRKAAQDAITGLPGVAAAFVALTAERAPQPRRRPQRHGKPAGARDRPRPGGENHRRRLGQGRRRQIDHRSQSRRGAGGAGPEGRAARRRRVRPLRCPCCSACRQAEVFGRRQEPRAF